MPTEPDKLKAQQILEQVGHFCDYHLDPRVQAWLARSTVSDRLLEPQTLGRLARLIHFCDHYLNPRTVRGCAFLWLMYFLGNLYSDLVRNAIVARIADRPDRVPSGAQVGPYIAAMALSSLEIFVILWLIGFAMVRIARFRARTPSR